MDKMFKDCFHIDLLYYEGPIISLFRKNNKYYLFNWLERKENHYNLWIVAKISEMELVKYLSSEKTLLDICIDNDVYFYYLGSDANIIKIDKIEENNKKKVISENIGLESFLNLDFMDENDKIIKFAKQIINKN